MTNAPPLWLRQVWDTDASYHAFSSFYLPMPAHERTLDAAYRLYLAAKGPQTGGKQVQNEGVKKKLVRAPGSWQDWYYARRGRAPILGAVGWADRAVAWDRHQADLAEQERQERARVEREQQTAERAAMLERHRHMGKALQELVWTELEQVRKAQLAEIRRVEDARRAGNTDARYHYVVDPKQLRPLLKLGVDVERMSLGLPSELIAIAELSDAQLVARHRELLTALARTLGSAGTDENARPPGADVGRGAGRTGSDG